MWLNERDRAKMKAIIAQYGGTLDPNKDSAEMSTVTHTMYAAGHLLYGHMTKGEVVSSGTKKTTVRWPNGKCGVYLHRNLKKDATMPQAAYAFSTPQYKVLAYLLEQREHRARTDTLATATNLSTQNVAHEGLGLREQGLVSTTNDGARYQLWTLTEHGLFVAGEIRRRVTAQLAEQKRLQFEAQERDEKAARKKDNQWVIWSPGSPKPITVRYSCEQEAMAVAESMAKRYRGQQFLCCEIHAGFKLVETKREKIVYETVTKMEQV